MAKTLAIVCTLQKQYGKTASELEMLVEGFCRVLRHRSMEQIIDAIEKFILKNPTIPSPADIENIINPPPPKVDWALYVELKKRLRDGNVYVDRDEKKFLRQCEEIGMDRLRGEATNYQNAQQQLENHSKMMLEYHD